MADEVIEVSIEEKRRRDPGTFDIHRLAQIADGFTGAARAEFRLEPN